MDMDGVKERFSVCETEAMSWTCPFRQTVLALGLTLLILLGVLPGSAQTSVPDAPEPKKDNQINVNWLYGVRAQGSSSGIFELRPSVQTLHTTDLHDLWNLYQDDSVHRP
jgi:hypothetical protein